MTLGIRIRALTGWDSNPLRAAPSLTHTTGCDYTRGEVGTTPLNRAPLDLRLVRANH